LLLLLLFGFYAAEKFYQPSSLAKPPQKPKPFLLLFSFLGFFQCLLPYAPKPPNFLIAQPIQTIIRRHAKRSHQRLHTSLTVHPMQA
jgi:hypothetical protein